MKISAYCQQENVVRGSSFWQYKVYAYIRGGSLERVVKQQWYDRQRIFSALSVVTFFDTSDIRPTLLYNDMESLVGFLLTPKHVTLIDPEWPFYVKFCFYASIC